MAASTTEVSMAFFADASEVDRYVGGILRLATGHPHVGPRLAEASTTVRFRIDGPDCEFTLALYDPPRVVFGPCGMTPDVTLTLPGDLLDGYWRGAYDLLDGLANGEVAATGQVSRVLKVLPHASQLFSVYRAMVAPKAQTPPAAVRS
jgi:hypothetical protein